MNVNLERMNMPNKHGADQDRQTLKFQPGGRHGIWSARDGGVSHIA